jgi:hypothetical protein
MAPQVEVDHTITAPAVEEDILREQLDYLIEHSAHAGQCGCSECRRYLRVRSILLEIFAEPPQANVQEIPKKLAKAA